MSFGKSTVQVYDFLMSVDYGLCIGPVDALNQVWIKDKPIFCGGGYGRCDIEIDLPNLFGGDDAEGGVRGILEFYPGTETQTASAQLASRWGLESGSAPGYRGLAHIFLRGGAAVVDLEGVAYDFSNGNG